MFVAIESGVVCSYKTLLCECDSVCARFYDTLGATQWSFKLTLVGLMTQAGRYSLRLLQYPQDVAIAELRNLVLG